jgi:3-dehydroquinate synthase
MKQFEISGSTGESKILIGETLRNLKNYLPDDRYVVITDDNVWNRYADAFPSAPVIRIGTGESVKTLETVGTVYNQLLAHEADRSTFIVGIGGGVVCDIAGFAASTFMRGVRFGFVASTLLSQVDASVGGKNGVNFHGYKNIVGVFKQPEFVICDIDLLKTLPKKEILSGFGEVVKHAIIGDAPLFEFLETNADAAMKLDGTVIERLLHDSIVLKASVVNQDEKEKGIRRILNFGHTFGHALEIITGVTHGEAVGAGMVVATRMSVDRGFLNSGDAQRIENLIVGMKLPKTLPAERRQVMDALRKDKKRKGDRISFIFLDGIGRTRVESISLQELDDAADKIW